MCGLCVYNGHAIHTQRTMFGNKKRCVMRRVGLGVVRTAVLLVALALGLATSRAGVDAAAHHPRSTERRLFAMGDGGAGGAASMAPLGAAREAGWVDSPPQPPYVTEGEADWTNASLFASVVVLPDEPPGGGFAASFAGEAAAAVVQRGAHAETFVEATAVRLRTRRGGASSGVPFSGSGFGTFRSAVFADFIDARLSIASDGEGRGATSTLLLRPWSAKTKS